MSEGTFRLLSVLLFAGAVASALATAWIYYRQLRVMNQQLSTLKEALSLDPIPGLIQYLESPGVREARRIVRTQLKSRPYSSEGGWNPDEKAAAAEVCAAYDVAGTLARLGRVDLDFIIEHWGDSIKGVREICQEFIHDRRGQESERYFSGLIWLADQVR